MKRIIFIFVAAMMSTAICSAAMSNSRMRKETRFLTDKMAYELNLNTVQYNDVYEINYDFIAGVRYLMDDVLRGEEWALVFQSLHGLYQSQSFLFPTSLSLSYL